jgi:uncharacterized protein YndB with AHSA1/START domain
MDTQQLADVRVLHRFNAPPVRVFDAWLDPDAIGRWLLASSPDDDIIDIDRDPRVGGRFSFKVRRAGHEIDHVGEYRELARPRRLAFTFDVVGGGAPARGGAAADLHANTPSVVSIDLASTGSGTELVLSHDGVPPEMRDKTRRGWATILDEIAGMLDAADARARGVPLPRPAPPAKVARSSR